MSDYMLYITLYIASYNVILQHIIAHDIAILRITVSEIARNVISYLKLSRLQIKIEFGRNKFHAEFATHLPHIKLRTPYRPTMYIIL